MRIFNLIGEGFHALRSIIITKESAMTDTSIINSTTPAGDAELPQFAIPDANVPTDPQLQRLSSPSTVAPATSEETPGETHVAPDATAQHTPSPSADQAAAPDAAAVPPADQAATPDAAAAPPADQAATPDAAAAPPADQAATPEVAAAPQPAEQSAPSDATAQPTATDAAADAQPQAQTPVADAAAQQASAQAVNAAVQETAPVGDSASAAPSSAQPAGNEEQSDFSAGVKDFGAAFDFVQQGIEHLGMAARKELFELARKYL